MGFPYSSAGKVSACHVGDLSSTPGVSRSLGKGKGYPLQCSRLENSRTVTVHGVSKSQTRLSDFHFTCAEKVKVKSLSPVQLFATPWTAGHQAPPSIGFSRQEYWSGLLFPSPGDLPEPGSPALQADALPSEPPGKLSPVLDTKIKALRNHSL